MQESKPKEKKETYFEFPVRMPEEYRDMEAFMFQKFEEHGRMDVSIQLGFDRSKAQNRLWHAMYKRIDQELKWGFLHARAHCKYYCGIPILKRDCPGFNQSFGRVFGHHVSSEEAALKLMNSNHLFPNDGFPVTRHFNIGQGIDYVEFITDEFWKLGVYFSDLLKGYNESDPRKRFHMRVP